MIFHNNNESSSQISIYVVFVGTYIIADIKKIELKFEFKTSFGIYSGHQLLIKKPSVFNILIMSCKFIT